MRAIMKKVKEEFQTTWDYWMGVRFMKMYATEREHHAKTWNRNVTLWKHIETKRMEVAEYKRLLKHEREMSVLLKAQVEALDERLQYWLSIK